MAYDDYEDGRALGVDAPDSLYPAPNKTHKGGIVAVIIVAMVLALAGGFLFSAMGCSGPSIKRYDENNTIIAQAETYEKTIVESGQASVPVACMAIPTAGCVSQVIAVEGASVEAGDVLLVMEDAAITQAATAAQAQLEAARSERAQAAAAAEAAEAAYESAANAYEAVKTGYASIQKSISANSKAGSIPANPSFLDACATAASSARAAADAAASALAAADARLSSIEKTASEAIVAQEALTIKAEAAGVITRVDATRGMEASEFSEASPAVVVSNVSDASVTISLSDKDAQQVSAGAPCSVSCSGTTAASSVASVLSTYRGAEAIVSAAPLGAQIKGGENVTVSITVQSYPNVYVLPSGCVRVDGAESFVEMVDEDATRMIAVSIIDMADDGMIVVEGPNLRDGLVLRTDLA